MEQENNILRIVTQISPEQRIQFYTLLEQFELEFAEKNNEDKLPVKVEKNIFKKLLSKFKKILAKLKRYDDSKKMAEDILNGEKEGSKLFILCQEDRVVGFEMAQIAKEDNRIVGYKPWMYIQKEFRNKNEEFIDEHGNKKLKNVALQLDRCVENWFKEHNVNYQKTSTGVNMLPNIITYIRLGFKPVSKNDRTVFFEKDMENPLSRKEMMDLAKNARQGILCPKENNFKKNLDGGLSLEEQKINSDKLSREKKSVLISEEHQIVE